MARCRQSVGPSSSVCERLQSFQVFINVPSNSDITPSEIDTNCAVPEIGASLGKALLVGFHFFRMLDELFDAAFCDLRYVLIEGKVLCHAASFFYGTYVLLEVVLELLPENGMLLGRNLQYLVGKPGDRLIIPGYFSTAMPISGMCRGWLKHTGR